MEKLFEKSDDGCFRLIRIAEPSEIKAAKIENQRIFVLAEDFEKKENYIRFFHSNQVGKKLYRATREKIELPSLETNQTKNIKTFKQASIKIQDTLDPITREKLLKLGR